MELLGHRALVGTDQRGILAIKVVFVRATAVPVQVSVLFRQAEKKAETRHFRQLGVFTIERNSHMEGAISVHGIIHVHGATDVVQLVNTSYSR